MSEGILVSKIRCNHPNKPNSPVKNQLHLIYIGTREGVDLSDVETENENLFIAKNNGLFGNIENENINELARNVRDLTYSGRNIYQGIISLTESDAVANGFTNKKEWVEFINEHISEIGKNLGIPITRIQWTAAFHLEKGHPHCHYMIWDKEDKVRSCFIHTTKQNNIREMLSNAIFREEYTQHVLDKTLARDLIIDLNKDIMSNELDYILKREAPVFGKVKNENLYTLSNSLIKLTGELPTSGRLAYKLLKPEVKKKVDDVVNEILQIPEMKKEYKKYIEETEKISDTYSPTDSKHGRTITRAEYDIKVRLANQVLKTCKQMINDENMPYIPINENDEFESNSNFQKEDVESYPMDQTQYYEGDNPNYQFNDDILNSSNCSDYCMDWSKSYKEAMKKLYNQENPDYIKIVNILKEEATNNNVLALHELGKIYEKGLGVEIDSIKAENYYREALSGFLKLHETEKNTAYIEYRIGKMYERGLGTEVNNSEAMKWYQLSAEQNNKYGQYSLGSMYLYGKGIELTDTNKKMYHEKALNLFNLSAIQGNAYASYAYAVLAENEFNSKVSSTDINLSYEIALKGFKEMYQKQQSDDLSYRLGTMYQKGKGTEINYDKAIEYLNKSVEYNNNNAHYALGKIYADITDEKHYDIKKALSHLEEAASKNHEYSQLLLGKIYSEKEYECYDMKKAISWLEKSAIQENDFAEYKLGKIYMQHEDVPQDITKALSYFQASAEKGNQHAQYAIGSYYAEKDNPGYDITKAISWLEKSAAQDNSYAQLKLGCIYLFDKNVKNVELGKQYLKMSIDNENEYAPKILDNYNKYGEKMAVHCAYGLLLNSMKTLFTKRTNQHTQFIFERNTKRTNKEIHKELVRIKGKKEIEKEREPEQEQ